METNNGGNEVGTEALKGYFDNLAATTINDKSVLEQLFANNSKISATNEDLMALVKNIPKRLRISK